MVFGFGNAFVTNNKVLFPPSFSDTMKSNYIPSFSGMTIHEAPSIEVPLVVDALNDANFFSKPDLICRFNDMCQRLFDIHSCIYEKWSPLISNYLNIYPLVRGLFVVVFDKVEDRVLIF